jgi:hypothetical protein
MFVSREMDHKWIGNYLKKKHHALCRHIGKLETTSMGFTTADFTDLIDQVSEVKDAGGIKLYFATYCETGTPEIDEITHSGLLDQLTFVFAATDSGRNDLGKYWHISPKGGLIPLSIVTAQTLVQCYQTKKLPLLTTIIKSAGRPNFKETRSFWYPLEDFNGPFGLLPEIEANNASGITAFIGSYGDGDKTPGGKDVSWQLNVVFVLAKTAEHEGKMYHYHFDFENTEGWDQRPDAPPPPDADFEGADTGNPCPPAVCGGGLG